ncbi:MAG: reverse transcriptase domain-containing protein [Cyanobacteria bacterium J06582_2]
MEEVQLLIPLTSDVLAPQVLPPVDIGGRLAFFAEDWASISADPWVSRVCKEGYEIPFSGVPPLSKKPISLTAYTPGSQRHIALLEEVHAMLEKKAIELVTEDLEGFYNRLFVVPKPNGKWRPVLDVSCLNKFVILTRFKMESPASVLQAIRYLDWMTSIDLSDAYFHIPIHPHSKKYLRFVVGNCVYQFRALPFGLSTAPQVFTRVFAQVARWLHLRNVRVICYLDDWLILSPSREEALRSNNIIINLSNKLGFVINKVKSSFIPSQKAVFLGMEIDTVKFWVRPRERRIENFLKVATKFISQKAQPAKTWQVILGHMSSLEKLVPFSRLRMRSLQMQLSSCWNPMGDPLFLVPLVEQVIEDVRWWSKDRLELGRTLKEMEVQISLYSDASTEGWGAVIGETSFSGIWSRKERLMHINVLELKAVKLALMAAESLVVGKVVAILMDNLTALAYIRKQGGLKSLSLWEIAKDLLLWAERRNIVLRPSFVPGDRNVLADSLSRRGQVLKKEWILDQSVCQRIWALWGHPYWDLFATKDTCRIPRYVSPVIDPLAAGIDAMLMNWSHKLNYAFPPFNLIPQILKKLDQSVNARMILIAPCWPRQSWFVTLCQLLIDHPRRLPLKSDLLLQPYIKKHHTGLQNLALTAWSLSSEKSEREAFREKWPTKCQNLSKNPQENCTSLNGRFSEIGAYLDIFQLTMPL